MSQSGQQAKKKREVAKEDARIERTQAQLAQAVIALASERDITSASVSELTRRAGINRATFYAHANSPVELLTKVLSSDLDELRRETIAELARDRSALRARSRRSLREIVAHVLRFEGVYDVGHSSSVFALRVVLAEHIEHTVRLMLDEGFAVPPDRSEAAIALYSAYMAHGAAGAVDAWLRLPKPRDPEQLIAAIEALYPVWYVSSSREPNN
ncbi:TetR/AcrR family transcriptional regulator [Agrobacterium arsenijevicii]|uniref:HTH tetR-type domain-containing protein n=1 Tax=Agrobacterium arsenijevicii TaxID=1585697 RepID=A0ABR5CYT4_9HYPH|nr:hypothetical protein RP75_28930 [Agrobacterium arsenijevicii]